MNKGEHYCKCSDGRKGPDCSVVDLCPNNCGSFGTCTMVFFFGKKSKTVLSIFFSHRILTVRVVFVREVKKVPRATLKFYENAIKELVLVTMVMKEIFVR